MSYRMKVYVKDTREGDKANKSGMRKVRQELVSDAADPLSALAEFGKVLKNQPEDKRAFIMRLQIDAESAETEAASFSL